MHLLTHSLVHYIHHPKTWTSLLLLCHISIFLSSKSSSIRGSHISLQMLDTFLSRYYPHIQLVSLSCKSHLVTSLMLCKMFGIWEGIQSQKPCQYRQKELAAAFQFSSSSQSILSMQMNDIKLSHTPTHIVLFSHTCVYLSITTTL